MQKISETQKEKLIDLLLLKEELEVKGDIHKLSAEFFFGTPANEVTKEQRQATKAVVFGVIYGKSAPSLAEDIHGTEKEAQDLIDKLMTKWDKGGAWLTGSIAQARESLEAISPHGRVRHLWGYLHHDKSVHGAMDRRAPNSIIQGFSSDVGFIGGRQLQHLKWNWFVKHGINFTMRHMNVVHDSTEIEVAIEELPIALYMIEHSYTTLCHRKYSEVFGMEMVSGFEVDVEIGGSFSNMNDWNYCLVDLIKVTKESMDWMKDNLKYNYTDEQLQIMKHNATIINSYRIEEIKQTLGKKESDKLMLIDENNVRNIGLKFNSN